MNKRARDASAKPAASVAADAGGCAAEEVEHRAGQNDGDGQSGAPENCQNAHCQNSAYKRADKAN